MCALIPLSDTKLMTRPPPWPTMCGNTACIAHSVCNGPPRYARSRSSPLWCSSRAKGAATYALFTRTSTRSNASSVASTMRCTSSRSSTSVGTKSAGAPSSSSSSWATAAPVSRLISATVTAAPSRANARATPRPIPWPAPVTMAAFPSSRPIGDAPLVVGAKHERARRHAGAGGDEHVLDPVDLVHRRAPHLARALGDAVHAVDVRLAELPAVGVDRQRAAELDGPVAEELLRFAALAEPELLELREHQRREVVVDDGGLDVVGTEPGRVPQLPGNEPHLGQSRDRVAVVARHHVLVLARALRGCVDQDGRVRQVVRPLGRGDDQRLGAVALLAAVEQVQRLDDPP